MPVFTTTTGIRVDSGNMTNHEALTIVRRIPRRSTNYNFAQSLIRRVDNRSSLTRNQLPFLHMLALSRLDVENGEPDRFARTEDPEEDINGVVPRRRGRRGVDATLVTHPDEVEMQRMEAEGDREQTIREETARAQRDAIIERNGRPSRPVPPPTTPFRPAEGATKTKSSSKLQLHMLQYDIPVRNGRDVYPNPSNQLRRRAIRTTKSVWVIPKSQIPYSMLNELSEAGGRWHCFRFDDRETDAILAMLAESLYDQVREAFDSLEDCIDRARNKEGTDRATHTRHAIERVETLLGDLTVAAEIFGLSQSHLPMQAMSGRIAAMTGATHARAREYARAAASALRGMTSDLKGLGQAVIEGGQVPWELLADAHRDAGEDETADRLQAVFGKVPSVPDEDDDYAQ